MSEKQWREVLLDELKTVRVMCQNQVSIAVDGGSETRVCGTIVEIPVDKLASITNCPVCHNELRPAATPPDDAFRQLALVLNKLGKMSRTKISFVLPS